MDDINKQFDELNMTEYNSNRVTIYRIHNYIMDFRRAMVYENYHGAMLQLELFFAEINAKLIDLKKEDKRTELLDLRKDARNHIRQNNKSTAWVLSAQKKLLDFLTCLQEANDIIGLGLTKKSDGFGGMFV